MDKKKILPDYFSIQNDISGCNCKNPDQPHEERITQGNSFIEEFLAKADADGIPCGISMEKIVAFVHETGLTPFQGVVMLIKNAFEGHVCLMMDIDPENLKSQGTYQIDLTQDKSQSLIFDFYTNLDLYYKGIRNGWEKLAKKFTLPENISFDSLLHFILANHLFKFPVAVLGAYEVSSFADLQETRKEFFLHQYQIGLVIQENLGDYHLVKTVNAMYHERFRDLIMKIRSKEDVLAQLDAKLLMANDPEVRSEKELEKKYFEFLVASKVNLGFTPLSSKLIQFSPDAGGKEAQQFSMYRLKQLYRSISKNCRETHSDPDSDCGFGELKDLFIEASRTYNEIRPTEYDYFIHFYILLNLLNQAVVFRKNQGLEISLIDFTGLQSEQTLPRISKEFITKTKSQVEDMAICRKSYENTSFKIKNICDEELALLHREYLEKHSEYLDERIQELLDQIRACVDSRMKENNRSSYNK